MSTKGIPSQFSKLEIDLIVVQDGSWMKITSKLYLTLSIVLIMKLFFQTFLLWNALDTNIFLFLLSIFLLILYFFLVMMKRHVTSQSHDMSHDVMS